MTPSIKTDYWKKPSSMRGFDWTATFDGYEPGDPVGVGATEAQAIADLNQLIADAGEGEC